jgi:hypothetical protein
VLRQLARRGYAGHVTVELSPECFPNQEELVVEKLASLHEHLARLLAGGLNAARGGGACASVLRGAQGKPDMDEHRHQQLEKIAQVCLSLHKMADYFLNNEPCNLRVEDFDRLALEIEEIARVVDSFCDELAQEGR